MVMSSHFQLNSSILMMIYDDIYEDHKWVWPSTMFSKFNKVNIHGFLLNVPNPPEDYLNGVYGKNWKIPNPNFGYNDYGK